MSILFVFSVLMSLNSFANSSEQSKGAVNGGRFEDVGVVMTQTVFKDTVFKLRKFFVENKDNLKSVFPEFEIEDLIKKFDDAQVEIYGDTLARRPHYGRDHESICEVFVEDSKIKCHNLFLELYSRFSPSYFIQVFQLYLQLIGVQDTRSTYPLAYNSTQVGARILNYVVKTGSNNLLIERTDALELGKSMKMETINANLLKESNISEDKLIKNSLNIAKERCKVKNKKVTFSDAHVFNKSLSTVVIRYICD